MMLRFNCRNEVVLEVVTDICRDFRLEINTLHICKTTIDEETTSQSEVWRDICPTVKTRSRTHSIKIKNLLSTSLPAVQIILFFPFPAHHQEKKAFFQFNESHFFIVLQIFFAIFAPCSCFPGQVFLYSE